MSAYDNRAVVLDYINAYNRGDMDGVANTFAPNAIIHTAQGQRDFASVRAEWQELIASFRVNLHLESIIEDGDVVAARLTERGIFSASFQGAAPTGRHYEITTMEWFVFHQGKIIQRWGIKNLASRYSQVGIYPSPTDEVFQRIGRNVVGFQRLEAALKELVARSHVEGNPDELEQELEKNREAVRKQPMGPVAGRFMEECHATTDADPELEDASTARMATGFKIIGSAESLKAREEALAKLISERNALIHHDLARSDFGSSKSCRDLSLLLDEQFEKISKELKALGGVFDVLRDYAALTQTEEFRRQLERAFMEAGRTEQ